jgi:hypothetical protein
MSKILAEYVSAVSDASLPVDFLLREEPDDEEEDEGDEGHDDDQDDEGYSE